MVGNLELPQYNPMNPSQDPWAEGSSKSSKFVPFGPEPEGSEDSRYDSPWDQEEGADRENDRYLRGLGWV